MEYEPQTYENYRIGDLIEILSINEGSTRKANVTIGDVYEVIEVDKYAIVVKLLSLLGDIWVDMEDIKLAGDIADPAIAQIIKSFDNVDLRKADDAQLNAYMNVAYESYLYAEVLINKRERMRTNK